MRATMVSASGSEMIITARVGGKGGAITAGLFLQEFVDGVPWAHLDIAGPAFLGGEDGYAPKGGTGFGVRTLLELASTFVPPAPPAM